MCSDAALTSSFALLGVIHLSVKYTVAISGADSDNPIKADNKQENLLRISRQLRAIAGGHKPVSYTVDVRHSATLGCQVVKLASCAAGTVIEVNGVPFTALSGTATVANNEFDISGADSADATEFAAAINNSTHASISGIVSAAAVGADTLTASTAIAGNTFVITLADGSVHRFIGVAGAATLGSANFSIDTGNTETATSIAAQINAYTPFSGKLSATSSAAVVTITPIDGNTFTLVGTASTLAESNSARVLISAVEPGYVGGAITVKTLGVVATSTNTLVTPSGTHTVLINGVTVHNATALGTATLEAAAQAASINASTNALVSGHVRALSRAGVLHVFAKYPGTAGNAISFSVTGTGATAAHAALQAGTEASSGGAQAEGTLTLTSVANGETCSVNGVTITAHTNTQANNQFSIAGSDTEDAAALCLAINNSTTAGLADVIATSSSNVVTIKARRGGISGNAIRLSSGQASIVANVARLAGGAAPTTVVPASERLTNASGTRVNMVF